MCNKLCLLLLTGIIIIINTIIIIKQQLLWHRFVEYMASTDSAPKANRAIATLRHTGAVLGLQQTPQYRDTIVFILLLLLMLINTLITVCYKPFFKECLLLLFLDIGHYWGDGVWVRLQQLGETGLGSVKGFPRSYFRSWVVVGFRPIRNSISVLKYIFLLSMTITIYIFSFFQLSIIVHLQYL